MPSIDALARLRDGQQDERPTYRHRTYKLESGVHCLLPAPRVLAERWARDALTEGHRLYRGHGVVLARAGADSAPAPVDLRDDLHAALLALPPIEGGGPIGRPYRDLRAFLREGQEEAVRAYVDETLTATRQLLPRWKEPSAPRPRVVRTPEETNAMRRERRRERLGLDDLTPRIRRWAEAQPPGRHAFNDLWALFVEQREGLSGEKRARMELVGRTRFYGILRTLPYAYERHSRRFYLLVERASTAA